MALIIRLLDAKQTNGGGATTVYSSTATTIVANIRLATRAANGTVTLKFIPSGGSARQILDVNKAMTANDILIVKPEITMAAGDVIEATTSVAMDCVVSGFTRD